MPKSKSVKVFSAVCILACLLMPVFAAWAQQLAPGQRFIEPVDIVPLPTDADGQWSSQGVGVLDPDKGGLGIDLWAGAKARLMSQMLGTLPPDGGSWVLRKTLETALLSTARPPDLDDASAAKDLDFVSLRAAALQKAGFAHSAARLLLATGGLDTESRAAIIAHTSLQRGSTKDACDWAVTWSDSGSDPADRPRDKELAPFWARLNILCTVLANQGNKARFMTALTLEQGYVDGVFDQLVNAATLSVLPDAPQVTTEKLVLDRPVQDVIEAALATRLHAEAPLPRDPVLRAHVLVINAPVLNAGDSRLVLRQAFDLARRGLIDRSGLDAILARITTKKSDQQVLENLENTDYDTALQLLAGRIGADNHDAPTWPALWQAMAQRLRPWRGAALELVGGWLDAISPANNLQTDLDEIALMAAVVRAAEGRDDDAARWLTIAGPDQAQKGRLMLIPFDWLAGRFSDVAANAWMDDLRANADDDNKINSGYAELAINLAIATGAVEEASLQPLIDQLPASSAPTSLDPQQALIMVALDQAASEGQKGMALLLALQAVGRNDVSTLDNGRIVAIVRALQNAGLDDAARMLAREALIGRLMPSTAPPPVDSPTVPAAQKASGPAQKPTPKKTAK